MNLQTAQPPLRVSEQLRARIPMAGLAGRRLTTPRTRGYCGPLSDRHPIPLRTCLPRQRVTQAGARAIAAPANFLEGAMNA